MRRKHIVHISLYHYGTDGTIVILADCPPKMGRFVFYSYGFFGKKVKQVDFV